MLPLLHKLADRLIGLSAFIGTVGLLFVVAVIVVDVVGRNFGHPLYGSQDLITMTMVIIVFGGMSLCARTNGHIVVDIFERSFSPGLNRAIDIAAALLGVVIFCLIAYSVFQSAKLSQMLNLSTNLLRLPNAWFQFALCGLSMVSAIALALRAVTLFIEPPKDPQPHKEAI